MHCKACDCELNDKESTRKSLITNDYFDLCDRCLGYIADDIFESFDYEEYAELLEETENVGDSN